MGVIPDQMHVHGDIDRRAAHDGDIQIVATQGRSDFLPVADRQCDIDVRIQPRKSRDRERHEIFCRAYRANGNASRRFARDHIERGFTGFDGGLDQLGKRQHFTAGFRQQHAVTGALNQRQSRQRLQIAKL